MQNTLLMMTTLPDSKTARQLAEHLVEIRHAACVNILPSMTSIYRWKGRLETGEEHLLLIKTDKKHCESLISEIKKLHPYELPEIIAVPISAGLPAYLECIVSNTEK